MAEMETGQDGPTRGSRMRRCQVWLTECDSMRFGIASTYLLLAFTVVVALSPIEFSTGPRADVPASVFSWLPESLIRSGVFFTIVRVLVVVTAALWAMRVWLPVSSWLTVVVAMLYWSLRMENLTNGAHIFNVTNMLLLIHAAWFHFYHREINQAFRSPENRLASACYPRWVFWLCVFYLGWFHSLAGFTKVATSGWGWGNGVSLQLWVDLFGWEDSPFGQLMMWDSRLTAWMQTGALLIECSSILIIFHRWLRYLIGLALFGFYLGVLTTFIDFGFHMNAALVFWFLLPVDYWFGVFRDNRDQTAS